MLRHCYLKDPIERTGVLPMEAFTKYVELTKNQPDMPSDESLARIKKIREIFLSSHEGMDEDQLNEIWSFVRKRLARNDGLAQFILDYDGAKSDYFFPWLMTIQGSPSAALEMAYNAGRDLYGIWTDPIPESDPINYFVRNDPTFVYQRERQMYMADLISSVQDNAFIKGSSKVVDLGAGRMAWVRWHKFRLAPGYQDIYAFDTDTSIDVDRLYGFDPESTGIVYTHQNFLTALDRLEKEDITAVMMGGLASYLPLSMMKKKIMPRVYESLVTDGVYFFDLQLDCPYYQRSVEIFDWPPIKLMKTATEAIDAIEVIRKELWRNGMRFGAEYTLDTYNEIPTSVMILLTKV